MTLGSELDWGFKAQPNPNLNGRAIGYSMGKVLGGGSSISVTPRWIVRFGSAQDWCDLLLDLHGPGLAGDGARSVIVASTIKSLSQSR
jgi:choline dehydrogenase-like flavoprotein